MKVSHITWNLAGLGLPLLAAVICIPKLLALLGAEGFGLLSLAWSLTALSGLFDLGLGRATTRAVADMAGREAFGALRATARTASAASWACGGVGAALVLVLCTQDLASWLKLKAIPSEQVRLALLLLAPCVPMQAAMATYRGVSEGLQQFRGVSLVRMSVGAGNFLAPWAMAAWRPDIVWATAALLVIRIMALLAFRGLAHHHLQRFASSGPQGDTGVPVRQLLADGGWLSVSAIVSPLLVQADRFLIATLLSTAAVTSYSLPFDIVTQLLILVSAVATVAYPAFATAISAGGAPARPLLHRWLVRVGLAMAVACGAFAALLPAFFAWWLGSAADPVSVSVGRWLCLGVWINALGAMYYAWLHAQGRFRTTARLHLLELPVYVLMLAGLLKAHGVVGAAEAWVLRVSLDTLGLAWCARSSAPVSAPAARAL